MIGHLLSNNNEIYYNVILQKFLQLNMPQTKSLKFCLIYVPVDTWRRSTMRGN
jgi:hypothetical protein